MLRIGAELSPLGRRTSLNVIESRKRSLKAASWSLRSTYSSKSAPAVAASRIQQHLGETAATTFRRRGRDDWASTANLVNPLRSSRAVSQSFRLQTRRWKTDGKLDKPTTKETPLAKETTEAGSAEESSSSSTPISETLQQRSEELQQRVKRVVEQVNLGDQLAVILIATFTALIVIAPYVVRQMKQSDTTDYSVTSEDPIDELTTEIERAWNNKSEEEGSRKSAVEYMLKDILKSQGLQQAARQFFIQILESPEFQAALSRLVKQLWTDLVTDPETVAQVIRLLQIAIQDPAIKKAAQQLVVDLVEEPEVKEALIAMVQDLGREKTVLEATESLLTEAAHRSLNDPEILDHSMEFATDVVGDELVQRQAGEALRNSVGHAVRPATTIFLTATGVGLVIFGVIAIGYARSSDQEAVLFETAARSLQTNATYGIVRIVTWPGRVAQRLFGDIAALFWISINFLQEGTVYIALQTLRAITDTLSFVLSLPGRGVHAATRSIVSAGRAAGATLLVRLKEGGMYVTSSVVSVSAALASTVIDFLRKIVTRTFLAAKSSAQRGTDRLSRASNNVAKRSSRALDIADGKVLDLYARLMATMERIWKQINCKLGTYSR